MSAGSCAANRFLLLLGARCEVAGDTAHLQIGLGVAEVRGIGGVTQLQRVAPGELPQNRRPPQT